MYWASVIIIMKLEVPQNSENLLTSLGPLGSQEDYCMELVG
jgi:hypothetical protein